MNILMILDHCFPPDTRVENEIESLTKAGHRIFLACYSRKNEPIEETDGHLRIFRFNPGSFFKKKISVSCLMFPLYFIVWQKFIRKILLSNPIDAIHIHDLPLANVGIHFQKKYGKKFVLDFHENWPAAVKIYPHTNSFLGKVLSPYKKWVRYEEEAAKQADRVIVVVEEAKQRFLSYIPEEKISVVSNTLNLTTFSMPDGESKNPVFTILYAGNINKHRGLQYVIDAIKLLKDESINIQLQIIGTGSYVKDLISKVYKNKLDDRIHFLGWKSLTEIALELNKSDIAIIPHEKSEHTDTTIPHKLFQYLYANRYILVSDCDPLIRIIKETNSGDFYRYNSPVDLAEKIKKAKQQIVKLNSKKHVLSKYNWSVDERILISIYEKN